MSGKTMNRNERVTSLYFVVDVVARQEKNEASGENYKLARN